MGKPPTPAGGRSPKYQTYDLQKMSVEKLDSKDTLLSAWYPCYTEGWGGLAEGGVAREDADSVMKRSALRVATQFHPLHTGPMLIE